MAKTAEQVANKWAQKAQGAGATWLEGIDGVTSSPMAAAVAAGNKWQAKMALQETFNKWKQNTGAITLEVWKAITKSKGSARYTSGIQSAIDKYRAVIGQILSYQEAGLAKIRSMPDVTLEDAKARAAAWIDYMAKFRKSS